MSGNRDFIVRSKDRKEGSNSSFIVNLTDPLPNGKEIIFTDVILPNLFYNIDSTNNVIVFNDGSARTATIPPSYYSNSSLLTALASAMTVASGVTLFTAAYNAATLLVTITGTNAFTINFGSSTISYALGYPVTSTSASSLTQTATNAMVLNPPYLLLNIVELNSTRVADTNYVLATLKVPILSSNQQVNYMTTEDLSKQKIKFALTASSTLHVDLRKDDGKPLVLMSDWSFTLRVKC